MIEGCPERIDLAFLFWVWNYRERTKPKVVSILKNEPASNVIWLRTDAEVEGFLVDCATNN